MFGFDSPVNTMGEFSLQGRYKDNVICIVNEKYVIYLYIGSIIRCIYLYTRENSAVDF